MSELCKKITYLARDGFQGEEGRSHESNDRESVERCQGASLSLTPRILTRSLGTDIVLLYVGLFRSNPNLRSVRMKTR